MADLLPQVTSETFAVEPYWPCPKCLGHDVRPGWPIGQRMMDSGDGGRYRQFKIPLTCKRCGARWEGWFSIPRLAEPRPAQGPEGPA